MSRTSSRLDLIKPSATIMVTMKAMELKTRGKDIVSLSAGEPDFDTPAHVREAAIAAIEGGQTRYTAVDGTPELKNAIIEKFRRDNGLEFVPSEIIASNGAKQSLFNLMVATLNRDDEVIVPAPYWVSYPDMVKLADGQPVILSASAENDFKITARQLEASLTENTRMLILNSPSNPTGKVYSESDYRELCDVLIEHPKVLIACDDIYEFIYWGDGPYRTFLNICPELRERIVIINGVSKGYAMTGWRIGFLAGHEELVKAMRKVQSQSTSCPGSVSQAAAVAALTGPQDCVEEMRQAFHDRYRFMHEALNALPGVSCENCDGAFYAFPSFLEYIDEHEEVSDDVELAEWLLETAGVATVPGTAFGAPGHLRLSYAAGMDYLEDAIARLKSAMA
ncbi:MAG: pyridoxal phosphate-dependent aminotransferase [Xanthomonadales bacterium]|nr:pyridoxal phosphate-dependent aminotransferase [Gammaproteobacteria bacterium]MBT8049846.1 pyridoxal phosphate-dependent aminotransferase [Gammaproteobacteria bacterium]MBT8056203.1 pyridoxal phosphate-dependent aminotransferase [Gammaproteobacteria bacterium]NNJ78589.1 pyridoxal phosphate-dependent aminotransferase [Xanthomonadales bacterium]NNL04273.1 pyridoxal phosphate-dependent aminotransferase [Xanthomonadales bacterium]